MEQKAKRIGKFNIIDILAVILILAVVAFVGVKLLGGSDMPAEQEMVQITYVVKAEGVPAEVYENCVKHIPSQLMASGALLNGEIVSVEREDYLVLGTDGAWAADPAHVNLLFTVETETPKTAVMTTKVGEQEIRIGKADHIIKTEWIEFQATTIVDVQWHED